MIPVRVTAVATNSPGGVDFNVTIPPGIQDGDLLIIYCFSSSASGSIANHEYPAKKWWRLGGSTVNTRWWGIYARVYNSSDPQTDYQFVLNASTTMYSISNVIRGHGITTQEDFVVGTPWLRTTGGGSQGIVRAPGITTPNDDYLVLGMTGEASNTAGGYVITDPALELWLDAPETPGTAIEWLTSWYLDKSIAGPTEEHVIDYSPSVSNNGVGIQFAVPPGTDPDPIDPPVSDSVPIRVSSKFGATTASTSVPLELPDDIQAGDLIVGYMITSSFATFVPSHLWDTLGWWSLASNSNSNRWSAAFARIYDPADPALDYTLTLDVSGGAKWITHAIRNHGVTDVSDLIVGDLWIRNANGGAQGLTRAPGITTTAPDTLVLAMLNEASSQAGSWVKTEGDFTLWTEVAEGVPQGIEWLTSWYKEASTSGVTDQLTLDWSPASSLNGAGLQIGVPAAKGSTDLFKWSGDDVRGFDHEATSFHPSFIYDGSGANSRLAHSPTGTSFIGKSPISSPGSTAWRMVREFTAWPTASNPIIAPLTEAGPSAWRVRLGSSGTLLIDDSTNTLIKTSAAMPLGQEVRIEILASETQIRLRIYDGPESMTLIGTEVVADGTFGLVGNIRIGQGSNTPIIPLSYIDDILVTDGTDWIGPRVSPSPITEPRIGIIGDSLTSMSGANGKYLYTSLEAAGIPTRNVYLWGVGGKRLVSADLTGKTSAQNIQDAKNQFGTLDTWVVALGTNDRPQTDSTVNADIDSILASIGSGPRIVWIGLTSKGSASPDDVRLNGLISSKLALRGNAELVDWDSHIRAIDGGANPSPYWLTTDTTHMTPEGYEIRSDFFTQNLIPEWVEVRRNLVKQPRPLKNPEWNAAGWADGGGTQARSIGTGFEGMDSWEMIFTSPVTSGGGGIRFGDIASDVISVTPGIEYTFSLYFESNASEVDFLARVVFYNSDGTIVGSSINGSNTPIPANTPTRLSVSAVAPPGAVRAIVNGRKNNLAGTPVGRRWRGSAGMAEVGNSLGDYFDGSSASTPIRRARWLAGENSSESVIEVRDTPEYPKTGTIGSRVVPYFSHDSLTVGIDKLSGEVVEAIIYKDLVEVNRVVVATDPISGWGNAAFVGLSANTEYSIRVEVDDVEQTDVNISVKTLPLPGSAFSHVVVAGSCSFTGSTHPSFDRMREDNPVFIAHMGDLHYMDSYTKEGWRAGTESSFFAPSQRALYETTPIAYTWDNHDRIIVNEKGDPALGLNLGQTDPATLTEYRKLAGTVGWGTLDTNSRTWVVGRVRYIMTDQWTVRDDGDGDPAPRTFLGAAQKQWFKDTLANANEEVIVWFCQWTGQNHANGRWNSFPEESTELENWIDARPGIKSRMVMIGGDSHSMQVTDGTRTKAQGQRFAGIPNYNISGFNRSTNAPAGGIGWLDDRALRPSGDAEPLWGGYSRITVEDDGNTLTFKWEGVRVNSEGVSDIMNTQTLTFDPSILPSLGMYVGIEEVTGIYVGNQEVSGIYVGSERIWP